MARSPGLAGADGEESATVLRDRDFRLVVGAVGLSALGDWVAIVALGLYVKEVAGSGLAVATLWVCLFGPSVAVAGHAGLLVDRLNPTRVLAGVSLLGALGATALAVSGGIAPVLALTALLGLVVAVSQPAEFALVPLLAGERDIGAANGQIETVRYLGYAVGPLLGGILFAVGGLGLAMMVNAATFAAVAGAAVSLRARRNGARAEETGVLRARDGIVFLFRDRVLSLAMLVAFGSLLFMSAVWVGELFFVEDVLGRGEVAYGMMLSVWTVGMAFGAMLVARRVAAGATATAALAAVAIQGLALALPAALLGFALFLTCMFIGGLAHGVKNVMFRNLIHLRVPDSLHGRAFAAYNGIRNSAELAAFAAGGLLIAAIGARGTVAYAGGLAAIVGLAGLIAMLRSGGAADRSDRPRRRQRNRSSGRAEPARRPRDAVSEGARRGLPARPSVVARRAALMELDTARPSRPRDTAVDKQASWLIATDFRLGRDVAATTAAGLSPPAQRNKKRRAARRRVGAGGSGASAYAHYGTGRYTKGVLSASEIGRRAP